ncbi:hypothetical protein CY0110_18972 [Crocosphaera chwakensis CCY0110]|uniref:Uncharacterized protein n=1 Tax=Crocosphaera chwakensis CCY0110 TaxID=391612 RepID=A3IJC6_9CHRO|nr:hypothetical protein CY0110_18972 [Crocosphaera chwakensis CCY0110]
MRQNIVQIVKKLISQQLKAIFYKMVKLYYGLSLIMESLTETVLRFS